MPTKDIIINKSTRKTRSSQAKEVSLKCLDTSKTRNKLKSNRRGVINTTEFPQYLTFEKKVRSGKNWRLIQKSVAENITKEKECMLDVVQPKKDESSVTSKIEIISSTPPGNQTTAFDEEKGKPSHLKRPKPKIAILAKKIGKLKKSIEATSRAASYLNTSAKALEASNQPIDPKSTLELEKSKETRNSEVVEVSCDPSDVDEDEFRKMFPNLETNVDFDTSDITDTETISSDEGSETSSSCILLDSDEESPIPSSSKERLSPHSSYSGSITKNKSIRPQTSTQADIIIPELPTSTTISRVRATNITSKSISKSDKRTKDIDKNIEVIDLE